MMRWAALAVAAIGLAVPAMAVELAPDGAALARAAAEGRALFKPQSGYPLQDHLIYAVRDARAIDPADGSVDAVVLATPLERTRHAAYFGVYERRALTPERAFHESGLAAGQIAFIVFAHGGEDADMEFPGKFSPAVLSLGDRRLTPIGIDRGGASPSIYPLAKRGRMRFVATITYRFELTAVPQAGEAKGRLAFTDATGKAFDLPVDLAAYR
jgi:hypothetical protein